LAQAKRRRGRRLGGPEARATILPDRCIIKLRHYLESQRHPEKDAARHGCAISLLKR